MESPSSLSSSSKLILPSSALESSSWAALPSSPSHGEENNRKPKFSLSHHPSSADWLPRTRRRLGRLTLSSTLLLLITGLVTRASFFWRIKSSIALIGSIEPQWAVLGMAPWNFSELSTDGVTTTSEVEATALATTTMSTNYIFATTNRHSDKHNPVSTIRKPHPPVMIFWLDVVVWVFLQGTAPLTLRVGKYFWTPVATFLSPRTGRSLFWSLKRSIGWRLGRNLKPTSKAAAAAANALFADNPFRRMSTIWTTSLVRPLRKSLVALAKTVRHLYKNRSRLSTLTDYTWYVGNNIDNNTRNMTLMTGG